MSIHETKFTFGNSSIYKSIERKQQALSQDALSEEIYDSFETPTVEIKHRDNIAKDDTAWTEMVFDTLRSMSARKNMETRLRLLKKFNSQSI